MKQLQITVATAAGRQQVVVSPDLPDLRLSEILRHNTMPLNTRCGGRGLCDGCLVQLDSGTVRHHSTPQHRSVPQPAMIRACEYELAGQDIQITVPARSLLAYEPQVVSNFKVNISRAHDPIWRSIELSAADLPTTTQTTLAQALSAHVNYEPVAMSIEQVQFAKGLLTEGKAVFSLELLEGGWSVTHVLRQTPGSPVGIAIDIGTTTVAILLVDLVIDTVVGSASGFNRQMHLGDDVLTRINLCSTDKRMLERLQSAIVKDTIERLVLKALKEANIAAERIVCINIAGNTTMLHLLAGADPSSMGFAPFTAPFLHHKTLTANAVRLCLGPPADSSPGAAPAHDPTLHLLPSAAAYVGADITAGVIASGLVYDQGPSLLVDVGTNGEIVFKSGDRMWGTATAAGPAFEGARMAGGMRAGQGAISHIRMRQMPTGLLVETDVIGDVKPTGLCGSAYIDFLSQAAQVGLLSAAGRFNPGVADDRIAPYRDMGQSFTVALGHGQEPIVISERDVAALLQAKAAVAAGILTLLKQIGTEPSQIKTLYLAGGFGMHLDIPNTIGCGLLPGFRTEQIQLVGNTSLAGAYLSMVDRGLLQEMQRVARAIQMVELNLDPEFESCYIDQLMLSEAAI